MKTNLLISIVLSLMLITSTSVTIKPKPVFFERDSKLFHSKLKLQNDNTYTLYKRSCTYGFRSKGKWKQEGDTVILDHAKVNWFAGSSKSNIELDRSSKFLQVHLDTLYFLYDFGNGLETFHYLSRTQD